MAQNHNTVRQLQKHVQILADIHDGHIFLLLFVQQIVNRVGRIDIQPPHGISRNQHRGRRFDFPSKENLLNISTA